MIVFNADSNHTNVLPAEHIKELIQLRGTYDYPKAYMVRTTEQGSDIQITNGFFAKFVQPQNGETSDLWLDNYHHELLTSNDPEERLLGLASVIYWGYFTFSKGYGEVRVRRLINGHQNMAATTPAIAMERLEMVIQHAETGNLGMALSALNGVGQLNRTPFASKVIGFAAPSAAGILDNRINDGIQNEPWAFQFNNGIGQTNSPTKQRAYQAWCSFLSHIASTINFGIMHAEKDWHWSCGSDTKQLWRAIDVERAFFARYGMENQ